MFGLFLLEVVIITKGKHFACYLLHSVLQSHQPENLGLLQIVFPFTVCDCHDVFVTVIEVIFFV
jgi:hypothetical protein